MTLASRIQFYLRETARSRAGFKSVGPFICTLDPVDDNPYLNYAIPQDGASPARSDIESLCAFFVASRRRPRLEYLPDAAPEVEEALLAAGFAIEGRYPVMTCDRAGNCPAPDRIVIREATTARDFIAASGAQAEAYANSVPRPEMLGEIVERGGVVVLAEDAARAACVGAGSCMKPIDGVSELGGIGVVPAHRKRGIASSLTSALTDAILDKGATLIWLTPGHDEAGRVYARAGFVKACNTLHIGRN